MTGVDHGDGSGAGAQAARRAAVTVERWAPVSISEAAAAWAREVVALAAPPTPARAKALLFAAGRLAGFAESLGLELSVGALLSDATVERFVLTGTGGVSPATARTLRTNLRALGRAVEPHPAPRPVGLQRERAKAPYSPAEVDGYLRLADAQSTRARGLRASALVCLGAGAGVIAGELRHVRGSDVVERSGGVLIQVSGARARTVPVLERYHQRLLQAARFAGERYLIGGRSPGRRNVTDTLTRALSTDRSLPRLQAGRLRSTWLVECADQIGLGAFMHAAGIACSQRLGDLAAQLPAVSEDELVRLLGGSR
jgi:integrase